MPKQRWYIEQKEQHVASWRVSGLTRQQYCELHAISFSSMREWPQDVAKAERRANEPAVLLVTTTLFSAWRIAFFANHHIATPGKAGLQGNVGNLHVTS